MCIQIVDRFKLTLRHDTLSYDIAAEIVEQRRVGEAWAWSRKTAVGSIAALEAATLAIWGLEHKPLPPIAPMIR